MFSKLASSATRLATHSNTQRQILETALANIGLPAPNILAITQRQHFHTVIGEPGSQKLVDYPEGTKITDTELKSRITRPPIIMVSGVHAGAKMSKSENWFTQQHLAKMNLQEGEVALLPETDLNVRALAALYRKEGHLVAIQPPTEGNIDGHYSTDSDKTFQSATFDQASGLWIMGKPHTLHPNFTHEDRHVEVPPKRDFVETSEHRDIYQMEHSMEFGDTRPCLFKTAGSDVGFILAGLADTRKVDQGDQIETIGRSTREGHQEFESYLKANVSPQIVVHTVELRQPFYHMDTTGVPTQGGHFFTNPAAYSEQSWGLLQELFGEGLIEIPLEDVANAFGGNGTSFGNNINISDLISETTIRIMTEHGYNVNMTPIPYTMMSGGGHRCMSSYHNTFVVDGFQDGFNYGIDFGKTGSVRKIEIDEEQAKFFLRERLPDGQWGEREDITSLAKDHEELYHEQKSAVETLRSERESAQQQSKREPANVR